MSNDDTFFGSGGSSDRTILKPSPGGRGRAQQAPAARGGPPPAAGGPDRLPRVDHSDSNTLAAAAAPLLSLAGRLSQTANHSDPAGLSKHIVQEIQAFEAAARAAGNPPESVLTARYVLCSLLDETVLNTPWGSQSSWAAQTLLSVFHKEAWGGEKFYQILDRLLHQPSQNLDLLELMYLCLSMGFEGRYRHSDERGAQLEQIRGNLYNVIRNHRGQRERDLSPNWRGVERKESPLTDSVPLWVVAALASGVAVLAYLGFLWSLNGASDPVALEVASLGRNLPPIVERRGFVQERQLKLTDLLQPEVQRGLLEVQERGDTETVTLRALFDSGSAEIRADGLALLSSISDALNQLPGRVLVTGHTDNVPSRTFRYPSNWHLSKSRAESVAQYLAASIAPQRIVAEPRADSDPVAPNDTPQNRATNRRVEITLFAELGRE